MGGYLMLGHCPHLSTDLAALAQVVIDRLRNEIANPAVFIGTNLFDELKLVGEEIDRRAHQAYAAKRS